MAYMCRKVDPQSKDNIENVVKYVKQVKQNFLAHRLYLGESNYFTFYAVRNVQTMFCKITDDIIVNQAAQVDRQSHNHAVKWTMIRQGYF